MIEPPPPSPATPEDQVAALAASVRGIDPAFAVASADLHLRLTKPRGSLGLLERIGAQLSTLARQVPPPIPEPAAVVVFAADHGVVAEGVTPWPQVVTAQMVTTACSGGAAISVLARGVGASLLVVDVGVVTALAPHPNLVDRRVRHGTGNIRIEPAMTPAEAAAAIRIGYDTAVRLATEGVGLLVGGEMGIGNTTAAAALIASTTGRPTAEVTGRGTGIDDVMLAHKITVIDDALERAGNRLAPLDRLVELGGLEIAALAGWYLGAAARSVPVIVDGVIALAAACVAVDLAPAARETMIAGHRSTEPGAAAALEWLGLEPVLDLGMRLGEGSGAALAVPIVRAAAAIMNEMATFDDAGIDGPS
jgi:nicotinate-nucleotide--dimethylbenzimidazole phosphoribosyltransferase